MNRREEQELVIARRELAMLQKKYQELSSAAVLVEQQRNQTEQQRVNALTWLISALLEYHEGAITLSVPLMEELTRTEYRLNTQPGPGGTQLNLTVVDAMGNRVEKQSPLEPANANGAAKPVILPRLEPEPEQPKTVRCDECGFGYGEHRPDCSSYLREPL